MDSPEVAEKYLLYALNALMQAWDELSVPEQGRVISLCRKDYELLGCPAELHSTPVVPSQNQTTGLLFDPKLAESLKRRP